MPFKIIAYTEHAMEMLAGGGQSKSQSVPNASLLTIEEDFYEFKTTDEDTHLRGMVTMEKGKGKAVGIAPRPAYNCAAVWQHDRGEIISNDQGDRLIPSYVAFTDRKCLIEDAAKN
ncbi:hypothetical protein SUGI_1080350 [Cryptomeria japonica]|nr:hypothetical protein SUGI_1080350 [Cryptomeria japonica]